MWNRFSSRSSVNWNVSRRLVILGADVESLRKSLQMKGKIEVNDHHRRTGKALPISI